MSLAADLDALDTEAALELEDLQVTLLGAGRTGSFTALVLAMLGVQLYVYDPDRLGTENRAVQLYPSSDIAHRRQKVRALRAFVRRIVPDARIWARARRYMGTRRQHVAPIVVLGVDTMAERRRLWEALRQRNIRLWLDVRLGNGVVRLHEVRASRTQDTLAYEESLHTDEEAEMADCADAGSVHAAAAAAALVAGALRAYVEGMERPRWIVLDLDHGAWMAAPVCKPPGV